LKRIAILALLLVLAGAGALAAEQGEPADHTELWKFANFTILAGVAGYFIYKKGGAFFAGRTEEIQRGLAEAGKLEADSEARYADMERRLAELGAQIETLRQQAQEEGGAEGERLREETARELKKIQAQSEQDITSAGKAARQQLRMYAADLAIGLAAGKIRERLTPASDGALIDSMVRELASRDAGQPGRVS
jgi:F0F1-type ATP synthase membrane subunit b/b'